MKKTHLSFFLFLIFILSTVASGTTIYVDDDNTGFADGTIEHPYQTIVLGIDHSQSGDTVYVFNGEYDEGFIIDESINLIGENKEKTEIHVNGFSVAIITVDDVNIEGFNFVGKGVASPPKIFLYSDNCSITNNTFTDVYSLSCSYAIVMEGANHNNISSNILVDNPQMVAIYLNNSHYNIIQGNSIGAFFTGLSISYSNNNIIKNNILCAKNLFWESSHNIIMYNTFPGAPLLAFGNVTDTVVNNNNFLLYRLKDRLQLKQPQVYFENSDISFDGNYWGRARLFPKLLFSNRHLEIDWHPALKPN